MSTVTISAAEVNKLRQQTGAGMMDCRKALAESNGDFEAAIDYLRKKGQKVAANRSDRDAKEGVVIAKANADNTYGILINLSSETDFVAKNADFIQFANDVADIALNSKVTSIEDLKAQPMENANVGEKLNEVVAKIGEKIDVVRFEQVTAAAVVPYIHSNYRIGVLVGMNQAATEGIVTAGKDVSMQIAAMNPLGVDSDSISPETLAREKAIAMDQVAAEGKTGDMAEKIAMGKLNKFFKENTLLPQAFVKDPSKNVGDYLKSVSAGLTVSTFVRVAVGA
ncbi:elongation factor Ts [Flavipsychrobacter stenotrophus]|uniref:Elongation factor Ts n=1 Tax=Flavipsychrobacter stenotrophus TaxID=2077091 RepID=A0A2S7SY63_9BACT|nr:translation elongation factor Ts [Flavipsychrobacter stenotrophus]PQJ11883.1 elongation factor Ts [Flavipsychrobacter stenotrophus]